MNTYVEVTSDSDNAERTFLSAESVAVDVAASESTLPTGIRPRGGVPSSIPRSQLYYWTRIWQEGERESLADLEAGRYRDFDTAGEAIKWLADGSSKNF